MDKAYPPVPPEAIEQALSREDFMKQLAGEQSATLTKVKDQPATVQQPH